MILILVTLYTANTAANITATRLQVPISGIADLPGKAVGTWTVRSLGAWLSRALLRGRDPATCMSAAPPLPPAHHQPASHPPSLHPHSSRLTGLCDTAVQVRRGGGGLSLEQRR